MPGIGVQSRADDSERMIALGAGVDDDAQRGQVEQVGELQLLLLHLVVDAVEMLGAALDLGVDALLFQALGQHLDRLVHLGLPLGAVAGDHLRDLFVGFRIDILEGEIFELPFELPDTEAMGERGENLEGFGGHAVLARGAERAEGAHVVQAVGQLDDDDAQVFRHGDEDLADIGGVLGEFRVLLAALQGGGAQLLFVFRGGVALLAFVHADDLQLGDAVHKMRDFRPELRDQLLDRDLAVLDDIVQQSGREGRLVHLQLRQDLRDLDRMDDVGLSAAAALPVVLLVGETKRPPHQIGVGLRAILGEPHQDTFQFRRQVAVACRWRAEHRSASPARCFGRGRSSFASLPLSQEHFVRPYGAKRPLPQQVTDENAPQIRA